MLGLIRELVSHEARFVVDDGVYKFVEAEDDSWAGEVDAVLAQARKNTLDEIILENFNHVWNSDIPNPHAIQLAQTQGVILEVACGPGFGNILYTLKLNPSAKIIANDLGAIVLHSWRRVLQSLGMTSSIEFAHFDMKSIPFRDGCVDAISSSGGFANIMNRRRSIEESFRILRPKGKMYVSDIDIDIDTFNRLPQDEITAWKSKDPEIGIDLIQMIEESGFKISVESGPNKRPLDPNESTIARIGQRHGIQMYTVGYRLTAVKP